MILIIMVYIPTIILTESRKMKQYLIIEKWTLYNNKATYRVMSDEALTDLQLADKKLDAYNLLNKDKNTNYFIVPFDENVLILSKLAS